MGLTDLIEDSRLSVHKNAGLVPCSIGIIYWVICPPAPNTRIFFIPSTL